MKLNVYLCKNDVQEFEPCLRPRTRSRQYDLLPTTKIENVDHRVYIVKGEAKKPKWLSVIENYVSQDDIKDVLNKTCSMVILFKVQTVDGQRIFAVCHGFGYHIIDKTKIEQNFGLITSLNCVDRKKIKSMDTRSLGVQTLQKKEASNLYTNLGEFAFEFESEILQTISGALIDSTVGTKMGGTDNLLLSTSTPIPLESIPAKCITIYEKFKLDTYKENFAFVDYIKHEKDKSTIERLDNLLADAINQNLNSLKISVVYPDQIDYEKSETFKFSGLRRPRDFEFSEVSDVTLRAVYNYIGDDIVDIEILKEKVKIIGLDSNGEQNTTQESLYTYLVFETELDGNKYILSNKKWYVIEGDYLQRVESELQSMAISISTPVLKEWNSSFGEGRYNEQYQNDPEYLWLDKQNYSQKNFGRSKVEIADLYHEPTNKLFFVKKLNRSATLSHLFSQATVSADLFKESTEYKEYFLNSLKDKWSSKAATFNEKRINELTFVYAIGIPTGKGEILEAIPVFSKINLLRHLKLLRKVNYKRV
jgi:uncharacterized protein (TIGR04141 family)